MSFLFDPTFFWCVTASMAVLAVIVFVVLQRVEAAYGMTMTKGWGPTLPNKMAWIWMELPAFMCMALIWATSTRAAAITPCVMATMFELHYFQRTFIFPMLMRGENRMPYIIMVMGIIFNTVNAYLIGGWIFYVSPENLYTSDWLLSIQFWIGSLIFITGMGINLHSDHVIRTLRKPGDSNHYIPKKGLYKYVTAANYFGEFTEWTGFAILTWSVPGAVFALWTFANLAPRAKALNKRYAQQFGREFTSLNRRLIIPFIY